MRDRVIEFIARYLGPAGSVNFDGTNMAQPHSAYSGSQVPQQSDTLTGVVKVASLSLTLTYAILLAYLIVLSVKISRIRSAIKRTPPSRQGRVISTELDRIRCAQVEHFAASIVNAFIALGLLPIAIGYIFMRFIAWIFEVELKPTSVHLGELKAAVALEVRSCIHGMLAKPEPKLDEKDLKIQLLEKDVAYLRKLQVESNTTKQKFLVELNATVEQHQVELAATKDKLHHNDMMIDQLEKDAAAICGVHGGLKAILESQEKSRFLLDDARIKIQQLERENALLRAEQMESDAIENFLRSDNDENACRPEQVDSEATKNDFADEQLAEEVRDFVEV